MSIVSLVVDLGCVLLNLFLPIFVVVSCLSLVIECLWLLHSEILHGVEYVDGS